jgi:homogentisate 1,2-dioxygenase
MPLRALDDGLVRTAPCARPKLSPNRLRWRPHESPAAPTDFLAGLATMATCGDARAQHGAGIHMYAANRSMETRLLRRGRRALIVPAGGRARARDGVRRAARRPGEMA